MAVTFIIRKKRFFVVPRFSWKTPFNSSFQMTCNKKSSLLMLLVTVNVIPCLPAPPATGICFNLSSAMVTSNLGRGGKFRWGLVEIQNELMVGLS